MDYQLNTKNLSSSKRSFHGRKLQYQDQVAEQSFSAPPPSSSSTTGTLSATYLTTDSAWKNFSLKSSSDGQQMQEMELKTVGTVGLVKRKQFLQKRDISRSHESLAVTDEETGDLSATRLSISNSLTSVHKQCEDEDTEAANKLLDIGRVASWAVGFEKLLNDEMGLHVFTEFLKKEFSQENIQFWIECEKYKTLIEPEEIRQKANSIWSTYLHDTDDGSCRINIDSRTRQECQQSLSKPNANIFEKAQSQIFQLMKLDSYTRFLKSSMYKDCIMSEMEGKSIPYTKQSQPTPASNEERAKTIDCLAKLKEDEKKDKKRSPLLPWTKAFIKWKRLSAAPETIKRDTPSSSSNFNHHHHHHQTALMENSSSSTSNKSTSIELTSSTNLVKNPAISSTSSLYTQSPALSPLLTIGNLNKFNKYSQQDSSLFNFIVRSETNQENSLEKKFMIDNSSTISVDASRFCRFIFPDSTSAVVLAFNSNKTIQQAINRLFAKRGITWYRTELYTADQQLVDLQESLSNLCGKEIHVESRILIRIDLPSKILCVRCDPKRTLLQVLLPIIEKLKYSLKQFVFYANDSLTPLNLNEYVGAFDNQRIFTLTRTATDLSSRQKIRTANDIFDMISDNDEDIRFDECGILKVVTHSKSTVVVSTGDYLHSPSPETSPTLFENDKVYCGPRR